MPAAVTAIAVLVSLAARLWMALQPLEVITSRYVADDYFYYLNVAYHLAAGHGATFDGGLTQTNGFHPLFLILLIGVFKLGASKLTAIYFGLVVQALAGALTSLGAFRLLATTGNRWGGALVAAIVGLNPFFMVMSVNGFETALYLFLCVEVLILARRNASPWLVGAVSGLACLARLDAVMLSAIVVASPFLSRRMADAAKRAAATNTVVLPWCLWSLLNFGSLLPDSGVMKLGLRGFEAIFHAMATTLKAVPRAVLPPFTDSLYALHPPLAVWLMGGLLVALALRGVSTERVVACWGGALLATYAVLANSGEETYFIRYLSPVLLSLLVLLAARPPFNRPLFALGLAAWHLRSLVLFTVGSMAVPLTPSFVEQARSVGAPFIDEQLRSDDVVASFDSGSLGYFAHRPVINLDGLMNHEIAVMSTECLNDAECWRRYIDRKGITVIAGTTASYWVGLFPEWVTWERLYESAPISDGSRLIVVRWPRKQ